MDDFRLKNILGIDFGKSKHGVALSMKGLSAPLGVFKSENFDNALASLALEHKIAAIVIGLPEGVQKQSAESFAKRVKEITNLPTYLVDETLSSIEAQRLSIENGMSRKKRHNMEDAYAACLILDSFVSGSDVIIVE
jgi:putative holliday junction resolvase